jgi:hypothetical protein
MKKIVYQIIIFLLFALVVIGLVCCKTSLKEIDGEPDICRAARECIYYLDKNNDKSVCSPLIQACINNEKETQHYKRFNFCKDTNNLPVEMRFTECMAILNQK